MTKNYLLAFTLILFSYCANSQAVHPTSSAILGPPTLSNPASSGKLGHSNTVNSVFLNYGWSTKPALPTGRWATGPVFSKNCIASKDTGYIYLISGSDASFANTVSNTRYNTTSGTYSACAAIPLSRTQVTSLRVGTKIYVIGGYGGSFSPVNTNSIYDIVANTWTTGAVMPTAVGDYAASVYKDSLLYYVGGYNGSGDVNTVQIYDTYLNTWSTGTVKPGATVAGCRMGITGNSIILVGGYSQTLAAPQSSAYIGVINVATPSTITWSNLPAYPSGAIGRLAGGVAFENNGKVYFGGGDPTGSGTSVLNTINAYNIVSSQWETGPVLPVGVSNIVSLSGIVHKDSLFLVTMGGYNGSAVTAAHSWLNIGLAAPQPTVQASVAICSGQSTTLTASNALSYSWSPSTGLSSTLSANPVSTPASSITYTVSMKKAYGCNVDAQVTVSVNLLPTVGVNTSTTQLCTGRTVTLNGTGANTYTWTGGITNNASFAPTGSASYTVTGTDLNGCSSSATQSIAVYALPNVTASVTSSIVCAGQTVTFNGSGASTYAWTGGVTNNTTFTPGATNSYTVTGTSVNGCTNTAVKAVTVNALPTVSASVTHSVVCAGETVIFNAAGATTYTWTNGVLNNTTYTPGATNSYTVTGTDLNGCTNTAVKAVTVNALPTVSASVTNSVVCVGESVIFNAAGATTYTWTNGIINNATYTPVATNSYTVAGTDLNGCTNTAVKTVTVNALPTVSAGVTHSVVCAGETVIFNGAGATTYTWTNGVTDNTTYTPLVTDSYTVTGTDLNGCNNTAVQSVTVNALPVITSSITSPVICNGATVSMSGMGGVTYTWTGGVTDNIAFSPSATSSYTVTGTDLNGCSNIAVQSVTVNALPVVTAIASNSVICAGYTVTMNGSGASTYTWTGGVVNNTAFSPLTTASYTVTGTDANGCSNSAIQGLTVNALPQITTVSSNTTICKGETFTLTASGANTYTWNQGSITGSTFTDSPVLTTQYTVAGTDINGCMNTFTISQLVSECTSLKNYQGTLAEIRVYPNPSNGLLGISFTSFSENTSIAIYNTVGQLILDKKAEASVTSCDLSSFASGIYFLKIFENGTVIHQQKIIKN